MASMTAEASGRGGRSSQARVITSCSWSEERSTEAALVVAVLKSVELQGNMTTLERRGTKLKPQADTCRQTSTRPDHNNEIDADCNWATCLQ